MIRTAGLLTLLLLLIVGSAQEALCDSAQSIELTISFDEPVNRGQTLFVFVNGQAVGSAPGTFEAPISNDGVPVEIGPLALRNAPLFSFVLRSSDLTAGKLRVVQTNITVPGEITTWATVDEWKGALLQPNTATETTIEKIVDGAYRLKLSAEPYRNLTSVLSERSSEFKTDEYPGKLLWAYKNNGYDGTDHITFAGRGAGWTEKSSDQPWTGFYHYGGGVTAPLAATSVYSFSTSPDGAEIRTELGKLGMTTSDVPIAGTSGYIVLEKEGFLQVTMPRTGTRISLPSQCRNDASPQKISCHLKKAKSVTGSP